MANYFDQFEVIEEEQPYEITESPQPKKQNNNKSYWEQFETVEAAQTPTNGGFTPDFGDNNTPMPGGFTPNFEDSTQQTPVFDRTKNLLQGGVSYAQNTMNDFWTHASGKYQQEKAKAEFQGNPIPYQKPNVAQGLGNIANDLKQFGVGFVQGIPQFFSSLKDQAYTTGKNLKQSPMQTLGAVAPAFLSGADQFMGDTVAGVLNIPETVAASYMGREYQPKYTDIKPPIEFYTDKMAEILSRKGVINYDDYLNYKAGVEATKEQAPLAEFAGELAPAILTGGRAAGLFGKGTKVAATTNTLTNLQKAQQIATDIGKAGGVGAGYGFIVNPQGSLAERSYGAGAGFSVGTALGAGGKGAKAGAKAAKPHVKNATVKAAEFTGKAARTAVDTATEVGNRLNPKNYETILETTPQQRGQRTVYEATKKRTIYKNPKNNTREVTPENTEQKYLPLNEPGTGFVMGEGSELRTVAPKTVAKQKAKNLPAVISGAPGGVVNRVAPNIAAKQEAQKVEDTQERIEKLENKAKSLGGEKTVLGRKYLKQAEELRNNLPVENTENLQANEIAEQKVNTNEVDVEAIAKERAELLNQDFIKSRRKYAEEQREKGWTTSADSIDNETNEYIASGKNQYDGQHNLDFANAIKDKDYSKLISIVAQGKGSNEVSKKLFTKYTGVKLPTTIEGKKEAILKWAGKDINEYKNEIAEANEKKRAEQEKAYKEQELHDATRELESDRVRVNDKVITRKELLDDLFDKGYELEKTKQGIKPVYKLWKNGKGYKFTKREEKLYIDELYKNGAKVNNLSEQDAINELKKNGLDVKWDENGIDIFAENGQRGTYDVTYNGETMTVRKDSITDVDSIYDEFGIEPQKQPEKNEVKESIETNNELKDYKDIKDLSEAVAKKHIEEVKGQGTNFPKISNELKEAKEKLVSMADEIMDKNSTDKKLPLFKILKKDDIKDIYTDGRYISNGSFAIDINKVRVSKLPETKSVWVNVDAVLPKGETYKLSDKIAQYEKTDQYSHKKEYDLVQLQTEGGNEIYIDKKYYDLFKDGDYYTTDEQNAPIRPVVVLKDGEMLGVIMPIQMRDVSGLKKVGDIKGVENADKVRYNDNKGVKNELDASTSNGRRNVSEKNEEATGRTRSTAERESGTSGILRESRQQEPEQHSVSGRLAEQDNELVNKTYKNQHELNKAIEDYINNKGYEKYNGEIPQEVKDWLKKYAGAGGLEKQGAEGKGLLSEYYTPKNIVDKMWDLTKQYVNTDGAKVLEPSVGVGRFLENAPQNTSFDVVEMNPVSAKITELLYPNANVEVGEFQKRFIDSKNNKPVKSVIPEYDVVIGNPPYGQYAGLYKGMGEGKKFSRLESYFINRGLDSLKENGVMTFIVPSSFLESAITAGKLEISTKSELLDAYRLPENTFDTTSIGTDIIVLRKTGLKEADKNMSLGEWFKQHPEKILGNVEKRKNRFGKEENYVKGDKNAVDNIDTSKQDIKATVQTEKKAVAKNTTTAKQTTPKKKGTAQKAKVEYEVYQPEVKISDAEYETFQDSGIDGTLPKDKYKPNQIINQYKGELYNDFNYLQGDIYEKLDALKTENITSEQKEIQRKKLQSVLPKPKDASEIRFNPTSDFIQEFDLEKAEEPRWGRKTSPLVQDFLAYIDEIPNNGWRDDFGRSNMHAFITGDRVKFNIDFDAKTPEYKREYSKKLSKLKNVIEEQFSNFVNKSLDADTRARLVEEWNRNFNGIYNPDYTKMPMLVKDLNANFKGKKLKLKETQIEGVNFLANKGVGLIGFEVGVGKTLTGIISTVQNMQMGRCKRPLVIIPKNLKKNWKEEFAETFPNIKVVDVDNLSKWDGEIEDGTVTLATYQALDNLWFDKSNEELTNMIYEVGNDFGKEITKRGKESVKERYEKMVGKALEGNKNKFTLEQLGFDHVTFDEAHIGKNLFEDAKADSQEKNAAGNAKGTNVYFNMRGGRQSKTAIRMFLLTQHILNNNNNRNVFMLTATPFNNQSLEVFNMLSYLAKEQLDKMGLYNVYQFNENFIDVTSDIVLDANNNPVEKQVELGFKNAGALREIINSVMMIRTADEAGVARPTKSVTRQKLDPTDRQLEIFDMADELAMKRDKEDKGSMFKAISLRRLASISPDLAEGKTDVSPEDFIKNSPKLDYIMRCVETMKKKDSKTSQIIYMPIGVSYLNKIKQYLVNKGVYKSNEIEIISSENASASAEKEEARISKITDSFNDREGDVKLIIGTQKIQVGMNLNKNTSTLYMPYVEWNPTDFVQTVGRMWRQGNSYKNVRVVVPLLKNSADSFMFQKLDEKTKRLNDLMGSEKEYIENSDLETEEEKIAMISNPVKRARMLTLLQKDKIDFEIKKLEARANAVEDYKNKLDRYKHNIEYFEKEVAEFEELREKNGELQTWQENALKDKKKSLAYNKKALQNVKAQIEMQNIEFDGKDSAESVAKKKESLEQELEKLKEFEEQKKEEFSVEYDKERKSIRQMDDIIKEFETETDNIYGGESDVDIPDFLKNHKASNTGIYDIDLAPIFESITKGIKGKDFAKIVPEEVGKLINEYASDYTFSELFTFDIKNKGKHYGESSTIKLNLEAIGNSPYKFMEVLSHELKHAEQYKTYSRIMAKPKHTWTPQERIYVAKYNICRRVNSKRRSFYNQNKKLCDKFEKNKFYSEQERNTAILKLKKEKRDIIYTNDKNMLEYIKADFELEARLQGENNAKNYKKLSGFNGGGKIGTQSPNNGIAKKWSLGTNTRNRSSERGGGEYSVEESEYKKQLTPEQKIHDKSLDKVYEWHGNIGKDRFDVDKTLNSFTNMSKSIAKEYSKKFGFNVTDKMVREVMPFLRERTGLPENLNRKDLQKFFSRLSGADKQRLTKLADDVSAKFDKYYKNYQAAKGVIDAEGIENHISHIWKQNKKTKSMLTNYFTTNSRFAKERTIETLVKGIEGFEVNGELVQFEPETLDYAEILKSSSDNLIKATHDSILANEIKNLKYKGKSLVLPASKAPSDWVEISHPALNKAVYLGEVGEENLPLLMKSTVKVHPAIAKELSAVFEIQKSDNAFWKAYDTINGIAKQTTLGFSGFHGMALSESSVSNYGIKITGKDMNLKTMYDAVAKGEYEIFKNDEVVKQAIEDGVEIGAPQVDTNRNIIEKVLNKIPGIKQTLGNAVEINNKVLWDVLHTMYKVRAYEDLCKQAGGRENLTKEQRRAIGQWVNDSFGGQAWELLGVKKSTIKAAGRVFLSPDWNVSAIRQFNGAFNSLKLDKYLANKEYSNKFWKSISDTCKLLGFTENPNAKGTKGKLGRKFFLRFAVYSFVFYNLINAMNREKDRKEHPELYPKNMKPFDYTIWANSTKADNTLEKAMPYVFLGRDKNGEAKYLRWGKQVREVPEMVEKPVEKISGKAASLINISSQAMLGMSPADTIKYMQGRKSDVFLNKEIWNGYGQFAHRKEGADLYKGMAKTVGKNVLPFVVSKQMGGNHEFSGWDLFAQTSKGYSKYKTQKKIEEAYRKGTTNDIKQIQMKAYKDGVSVENINKATKEALKSYKANNTMKYKRKFIDAMRENNKNKVQRIANDMRKNHIPAEEQKRVYENAYKDYLKYNSK